MALGESFHVSEPSFPGLNIQIIIVPTSWLVVRFT